MGVCNCSMFCCTLLYVHSSVAIILMGKRELIALLNLSSWCLVKVERLFLAVPRRCLQLVIVVFPDHTHLLCSMSCYQMIKLCMFLFFEPTAIRFQLCSLSRHTSQRLRMVGESEEHFVGKTVGEDVWIS